MSEGENKVGRGSPPSQHRFKKGQSGNPKGRPKGVRNLRSELEEELKQKIRIREGNKESSISKQRAIIKAMVGKALKGDTRAALAILTVRSRLINDEGILDGDVSDSDKTLLDEFLDRELAKRARREEEGLQTASRAIREDGDV